MIARIYGYKDWSIGSSVDITFQITDACSCRCTYCYEQNKGTTYMTKETARKIVDLLFRMYDEDDPDALINKNTHSLTFNFIGGEPLMNVPVIDEVCGYFLEQCMARDHEWLYTWCGYMISNGDLYFNDEVQALFKKYGRYLQYSVSIDGPKDLHDSCRVHVDGSGNFDNAYRAQQAYRKDFGGHSTGTKCTIAPQNLSRVGEIVEFFYNEGFRFINMNPIAETEWTYEQASEYYWQLKKLADFCLEKKDVNLRIFNELWYHPLTEDDVGNTCGGYGAMLAFDPYGNAYPCLRYMASSLGTDAPPVVIGDYNGIYKTNEARAIRETMRCVNRKDISTRKCFKCPVAAGCMYCAAWNYQSSGGCWNVRNTNDCHMHQAASLANVYYWNKRYQMEGSPYRFKLWLPRSEAERIVGRVEYYKLKNLEK